MRADAGRRDLKILGLISVGHFMSHFYSLTLPPLFPFLKEEFQVSYAELGMMMMLTSGASAAVQVPVGFLVDRYGARVVLAGGLGMISVGYGLIGLAPVFWLVLGLNIFAGIGNSVFHPADYAILNSSISPGRMGRAFSIHTFAGHLGSAAAPVAMILLAATVGWRAALVAAGIFGFLVMLAVASQWGDIRDDIVPMKPDKADAHAHPAQPAPGGIALLLSKPIVLFFLFFATLSMSTSAIQAFSVSALVQLHDMPVTVASTALSVYLFCSAAGILLGGEISDRTNRHELLAGGVFVLTAIFCVILAWVHLGLAALAVLMAVMGLGQGMIRPARDMMLRAAAPSGSVGKLFGFVSTGIAVGSAIAPVPFGWLLDIGRPDWVFYLLAIFMMIALFTVFVPKEIGGSPTPEQAKA